jgi:hypothetical protein
MEEFEWWRDHEKLRFSSLAKKSRKSCMRALSRRK